MKRRHSPKAAEADLTPMLDIVFILLIFFIVTAIFIKENAINMTPPPPSDVTNPPPIMPAILVRIGGDGLVRVNGELSDIEAVRARVERLLAEDPEQSVLVQAHPSAKNRLVVMAVDQAYSAGVMNVGFAVDAS